MITIQWRGGKIEDVPVNEKEFARYRTAVRSALKKSGDLDDGCLGPLPLTVANEALNACDCPLKGLDRTLLAFACISGRIVKTGKG